MLLGVFGLVGFSTFHSTTLYQLPEISYFPEKKQTHNLPTIEGAQLGRYLFYDTILSLDYSLSCASCHKQEYAFSDSPKAFSQGIKSQTLTRNTPPLFNLIWYSSFFWDGRAENLEEQVFFPVSAHNEMNLDWQTATKRISESSFYKPKFNDAFGEIHIDSLLIAKAISQFEQTLISHNSKYDSVLRRETILNSEEYEGFVLMNDQTKGDCLHCHTTDADGLGTTGGFSNNGLDMATKKEDYSDLGKAAITNKISDVGAFKIPSLRNIALTSPYMHDGRFKTLEEVINFYSTGVNAGFNVDSKMEYAHQRGVKLNKEEKRKIILFLNTLTDSVFISNPDYGNPFDNRQLLTAPK